MRKYLLSNQNCIILSPNSYITKGNCKILAHNYQVGTVEYIPLEVYNFILENKNLQEINESDKKEFLLEAMEYYINKGFFICIPKKIRKNFTSKFISIDYDNKISNAIIYFTNLETFKVLIDDLIKLGVFEIQIRFPFTLKRKMLDKILSYFDKSQIENLELVFNKFYIDFHFIEKYYRVSKIYFIGIEVNNNIRNSRVIVEFIKGMSDIKACGMIRKQYFSPTYLRFFKNKHQNSCLYKKITIDTNGNIKNCPSMTESIGNIRDTTLAEAIEKPGFKKYWDINKDKIHVCKDCEFRYICTDCRAYVEDPQDILSKPLKCGYNPYTGEWSEWSTNPLKQKAIDFYEMREMVEER